MPNVGLSVRISPPPFQGPSQGRFRMARHQLTGGGGIAFQRSGVGDWVALLSKGFTQRHHQSTHFSFFRGRHGITMGEQGGYRDEVHHSPSSYFIFSPYTIYVRLIWQVQHRGFPCLEGRDVKVRTAKTD